MHVVSVNTGQPREVPYQDGTVLTSIFKQPRPGPVAVGCTGLDGDRQADLENHGGANKAIYAYPLEHYAYWAKELGRRELVHGQFGENLTTSGLLEDNVRIGDVLSVGSSVLQVTQPRKPCFKLGLRMSEATFPKAFLKSGRTGFYLRIVESGAIEAGDRIRLVSAGQHALSIHDLWRLVFVDKANVEGARHALAIPWLADEFRKPLARRLAADSAGS